MQNNGNHDTMIIKNQYDGHTGALNAIHGSTVETMANDNRNTNALRVESRLDNMEDRRITSDFGRDSIRESVNISKEICMEGDRTREKIDGKFEKIQDANHKNEIEILKTGFEGRIKTTEMGAKIDFDALKNKEEIMAKISACCEETQKGFKDIEMKMEREARALLKDELTRCERENELLKIRQFIVQALDGTLGRKATA